MMFHLTLHHPMAQRSESPFNRALASRRQFRSSHGRTSGGADPQQLAGLRGLHGELVSSETMPSGGGGGGGLRFSCLMIWGLGVQVYCRVDPPKTC